MATNCKSLLLLAITVALSNGMRPELHREAVASTIAKHHASKSTGECNWKLCTQQTTKLTRARLVGSGAGCKEEAVSKGYPHNEAADRPGSTIVVNPGPCVGEAECSKGNGYDYWTNDEGAYNTCYSFASYKEIKVTGIQPKLIPKSGCTWKRCRSSLRERYVGLGAACEEQAVKKGYPLNSAASRAGDITVVNPGPCEGADECSKGNGYDHWKNDQTAFDSCYGFAGYTRVPLADPDASESLPTKD